MVATVTATTQPPIQVQRTLPHEEQAPDKQHDDDDVKEEEGEPQQPVKLITGKAKKPSSAADKVVNNIDLRTPPVARVTPRVIMSTGFYQHTLPQYMLPTHTLTHPLNTRHTRLTQTPIHPVMHSLSTLPRPWFHNCRL